MLDLLALLNKSSQSYVTSLAKWDHKVLPANRHKWTDLPIPQPDGQWQNTIFRAVGRWIAGQTLWNNVWKIRLSQKTRLYRPTQDWLSFSSSIFDWRTFFIFFNVENDRISFHTGITRLSAPCGALGSCLFCLVGIRRCWRAGTRLTYPRGMEGWVELCGFVRTKTV